LVLGIESDESFCAGEADERRHANPNAWRKNRIRRERRKGGSAHGGDEKGNRGQQSNGLHEKVYWVCIEAVQWSAAHGRLPETTFWSVRF
jgi:hypothetical protein